MILAKCAVPTIAATCSSARGRDWTLQNLGTRSAVYSPALKAAGYRNCCGFRIRNYVNKNGVQIRAHGRVAELLENANYEFKEGEWLDCKLEFVGVPEGQTEWFAHAKIERCPKPIKTYYNKDNFRALYGAKYSYYDIENQCRLYQVYTKVGMKPDFDDMRDMHAMDHQRVQWRKHGTSEWIDVLVHVARDDSSSGHERVCVTYPSYFGFSDWHDLPYIFGNFIRAEGDRHYLISFDELTEMGVHPLRGSPEPANPSTTGSEDGAEESVPVEYVRENGSLSDVKAASTQQVSVNPASDATSSPVLDTLLERIDELLKP